MLDVFFPAWLFECCVRYPSWRNMISYTEVITDETNCKDKATIFIHFWKTRDFR